MINCCIMNPPETDPLAADDTDMIALLAYVIHECGGVKPEA